MADDWRIRIDVAEEPEHFLERLGLDLSSEARELAKELEGRRLVVSRDDDTIFVYAGTQQEAERARAVIEAELRETGADANVGPAERWLPGEDRWSGEPAEEFEAEETVLEHGYAPWEVRIDTASQDEADRLAARLEGEGRSVVRRHRYVLVGADTEEEAETLAQQLHGEAEASGALVYETLPQNPFVVFGGLGGSGTPL